MEYFKFLPVEITLDILSRLPTEMVLECKLVSTNWRSLVRHPSFSKMHFRQHLNNPHSADGKLGFLVSTYANDRLHYNYLEYNENCSSIQRIRKLNLASPFRDSSFVNSCNGLMCFDGNRSVYICNPITREYVSIPQIRDSYNYTPGRKRFCYVPSTNEYKVLTMDELNTITTDEVKTKIVGIHIYTLGSGDGWRYVGNLNYEFDPYDLEQPSIANGALCWLAKELRMIITFDLAEEKFREHLSPPPLPLGGELFYRMGVLDGFLFFGISVDIEEPGYFDIWLFKKKNGNHEMKEGDDDQSLGWIKEFRVNHNRLLAVTKSDGVLTYGDHNIKIYDTKTSTSKKLVKFKNFLLGVSPHKNTLVSLKELGEEGIKTMEPTEIEEPRCRDYRFKHLKEDANPEYRYL